MAPTPIIPAAPVSTNNTSVLPAESDNLITISSEVNQTTGVDPAKSLDMTGLNDGGPVSMVTGSQAAFDKRLEANSIRVLKTVFRKWKRSRKRGAATLVTRYTRRGKPVY